MKKHFLTLLTACILPLCVAAQHAATIDGIKYYMIDGEATVMVQDEALSGDIVIPPAVSYGDDVYTVSSITSGAFRSTDITSIVLPDGITELPDNSFSSCGKLASVTLPDGLKSMGQSCFSGSGIEGISLPETLTSLGRSCFYRCGKLTTIDLPDGITSLPDNCFYGCDNLETVTLPDALVSIGNECFQNSSITQISMPNSVTYVGHSCFYGCKELESAVLSEGLVSLNTETFSRCSSLKSITIPSKTGSIGDDCFEGCIGLETVILPNTVTYLGKNCFQYCSSLASINLPNSLTSISNYCFRGCTGLKSVIIPDGITSLGSGIFNGCTSLESIILPGSLTRIGISAFAACTKLDNVTIPEGVVAIGTGAFSGCTALSGIVIPQSVTLISGSVFSDCTSLFSVTVNWDSLDGIYIGAGIFDGIFSDSRLYVPEGTSDIYRTTEPWSSFKYIVEHDGGQSETKVCDTPAITYEDGELVFSSSTDGAEYHYTITDSDITSNAYSADGRIQLAATYEISVYASASGHKNSETATATLCFIDADLSTDGIAAVSPKRGIVITSRGGTVTVSGLDSGERVCLYGTSGVMLASAEAGSDGTATLNTGGTTGAALLKAGANTVKIMIK